MDWFFWTAILGAGLFVWGLLAQDPNWGSADFGIKLMFDGGLLVVISHHTSSHQFVEMNKMMELGLRTTGERMKKCHA